ncbi:hypothetical protein JQS43_23295 [Natronosporangium hydrolyticum]|uniref:Uncharacterized protein n=1 Tax=Natronosporangium hydrolyticum TaxID=2811111 RepID=A0A895Y9E7_9ACTN|nr:hypothetical protein [Natronosporangium hydrolyticum]QSB14384.1 hypothetical protein JQS43_23295 [Natronosporangium hydrolyticum]
MNGSGSASPEVLEWAAASTTRPGWWHRLDPRIAQLVSCLGLAALAGALIVEWQVVELATVNRFDVEVSAAETRLAGLGAWGTGFIVGVLLLLGAVGAALYGPPVTRAVSRAAGLAVGAGTLVVLLGAVVELRESAPQQMGFPLFTGLPAEELEVTVGLGVYAGFAAVLLLVLALALVRPGVTAATPFPHAAPGELRPEPAMATEPPATGDAFPGNEFPANGFADPDFAVDGQRSPAAGYHGAPADGPSDLTVGPSEPFAGPADGREWR